VPKAAALARPELAAVPKVLRSLRIEVGEPGAAGRIWLFGRRWQQRVVQADVGPKVRAIPCEIRPRIDCWALKSLDYMDRSQK
jgi:hypothetical protein